MWIHFNLLWMRIIDDNSDWGRMTVDSHDEYQYSWVFRPCSFSFLYPSSSVRTKNIYRLPVLVDVRTFHESQTNEFVFHEILLPFRPLKKKINSSKLRNKQFSRRHEGHDHGGKNISIKIQNRNPVLIVIPKLKILLSTTIQEKVFGLGWLTF